MIWKASANPWKPLGNRPPYQKIWLNMRMQITRARLAALALSALALFALAALTGSSPLRPAAPPVPLPPAGALQPGDWVFRSGVSADSRLIRHLSGSAYSHIGIVIQTAPQVLVAHATDRKAHV